MRREFCSALPRGHRLRGRAHGTVVAKHVGSTESYAIAVPAGTYLVNAVATLVFVNGEPAKLLENE
jgi:hypothetical protein